MPGETGCPATLTKAERLCSTKLIETLFNGNSTSYSLFPLRLVFMAIPAGQTAAGVSVLINVPKKKFKRAVKRNFIKRQIREAYRKHKQIVTGPCTENLQHLLIAFLWVDNHIHSSCNVEAKVQQALQYIARRGCRPGAESGFVRPESPKESGLCQDTVSLGQSPCS